MRIVPKSLAFITMLASFAQAAVVNIDFGNVEDSEGPASPTYTGLAAAPDPANASAYWNTTSAPLRNTITADSLLDSTGAASAIALSLEASNTFASLIDQEFGGGADGAFIELMGDYAFIDSGSPDVVRSATGTLSGLIPTGSYDLYFYGQGDNFTRSGPRGQNTLFTLGGISQQTGWDGLTQGDGLLSEGIEYVKFTAEADAEGRISFTWANVVDGPGGNVITDSDALNSRYAAFNGLQIVSNGQIAVPEPSVALLGGLGLLALLRRRRTD